MMFITALPLVLSLTASAHVEPAPAPAAIQTAVAQRTVETVKEKSSGHRYPITADAPLRDADKDEKDAKPAKLHLTGLAIREKTIFNVNVYSYVLYVDEEFAKAKLGRWKGKSEKQVSKDAGVYTALLRTGGTKELRIRFCRNVSADDVVSAFEDSLEPRILKRREGKAGTKAEKLKDVQTFRKMFSLDKLRKNNEMRFTWHPDGTLSTVINGKRQRDMKSADLCWALFDVYIGSDPIMKTGKKNLVRGIPGLLQRIGS